MQWLLVLFVLAIGAVPLLYILQRTAPGEAQRGGLECLRADLRAIYLPVAHEIGTGTTALGLTLSEAFAEREANRQEMAWLAVGRARRDWRHVAELVVGLLDLLDKFLPATSGLVIVRRVAMDQFKSRPVMDYVPLYEFLDNIFFTPERRFALQLRFLFRAVTSLSKDFKRSCCEGAFALDFSEELWTRLDYYFHDLDLTAKETLMVFRTLLACQSPERAQELALELQVLLERGRPALVPARTSRGVNGRGMRGLRSKPMNDHLGIAVLPRSMK